MVISDSRQGPAFIQLEGGGEEGEMVEGAGVNKWKIRYYYFQNVQMLGFSYCIAVHFLVLNPWIFLVRKNIYCFVMFEKIWKEVYCNFFRVFCWADKIVLNITPSLYQQSLEIMGQGVSYMIPG